MKAGKRVLCAVMAVLLSAMILPLSAERVFAYEEETLPEGAKVVELVENAHVGVVYNDGNAAYYHFVAPETGYYGLSVFGKDDGYNSDYLIHVFNENGWTQPSGMYLGGFGYFMIKGGDYYYVCGASGEDEADGYSLMVSKVIGFDAFTKDCETWNPDTEPSKAILLPANDPGTNAAEQFVAAKVSVSTTGRYRLTSTYGSGISALNKSFLLDEEGNLLTEGTNELTSIYAEELIAGRTYYLLPGCRFIETASVNLTGEVLDPERYCTDGLAHSEENRITKGSFEADGSGTMICSKCGREGESWTIPKVGLAKLLYEKVNYAYTGEPIEPEVWLSAGGTTLTPSDYSLEYSDNIAVGTASVRITLQGDWEGSKVLKYNIYDPNVEEPEIAAPTFSIVPPKAGATPDDPEITIPSGSHFKLYWSDWRGPEPDFEPYPDEYTFEAGKKYRVSLTFVADPAYYFSYSAAPVISGGTLIGDPDVYTSDDSWMNVLVEVTAAEAAKKAQTITAKSYTKTFGNAAFSLGAKTSGDGKLTYKSGNTKVATVSTAGKVTIKGAGTAKITITAAETANFKKAVKTVTITVNKAKNPLTAKAKSKTNTVKYTALKKANQTITAKNAFVVSGNKGAVTYKKTSGNARILVSSAGKITVKKGLAKKTYTVKVSVKAAGNGNYKAGTKEVTLKIAVK